MKRRSLLYPTMLFVLAGSLAAASAEAQVRRNPTPPPTRATPTRPPVPEVTGASTRVLRLSKGGDAKVITITGRHLEGLTAGRIERPNGRVLPADVRLPGRRVPRGGLTRRPVRIQATPRTGTGNRLKLVLTTAPDRLGRTNEVTVPVRLVVLNAVRIDRTQATGELRAGGDPVRYVVAGQGIGQLHHPRLERNGRAIPGTSVRFAARNPRRAELELQAGADVVAGPAAVVAGTVDRPIRIGRVDVAASRPVAVRRPAPRPPTPTWSPKTVTTDPLRWTGFAFQSVTVDTETLRWTGFVFEPVTVDTEPLRWTGFAFEPVTVKTEPLRWTGFAFEPVTVKTEPLRWTALEEESP